MFRTVCAVLVTSFFFFFLIFWGFFLFFCVCSREGGALRDEVHNSEKRKPSERQKKWGVCGEKYTCIDKPILFNYISFCLGLCVCVFV